MAWAPRGKVVLVRGLSLFGGWGWGVVESELVTRPTRLCPVDFSAPYLPGLPLSISHSSSLDSLWLPSHLSDLYIWESSRAQFLDLCSLLSLFTTKIIHLLPWLQYYLEADHSQPHFSNQTSTLNPRSRYRIAALRLSLYVWCVSQMFSYLSYIQSWIYDFIPTCSFLSHQAASPIFHLVSLLLPFPLQPKGSQHCVSKTRWVVLQ